MLIELPFNPCLDLDRTSRLKPKVPSTGVTMAQFNPHTSNVLVMSNEKNTPQSNFDTSENVSMITTDLHTSHDVSMATFSSDTSPVQVKVEKPDSPLPPQIQTCQIFSTEMSMNSPGNRLYDHSEDIPKRKRIQLSDRPRCSVCMKTFSRSGTLRVLYNLVSYSPLFLALTFQLQYLEPIKQ